MVDNNAPFVAPEPQVNITLQPAGPTSCKKVRRLVVPFFVHANQFLLLVYAFQVAAAKYAVTGVKVHTMDSQSTVIDSATVVVEDGMPASRL